MCWTEAEKSKQLRIDELSNQEKESKSTVNQFMVQSQELQDNANSLNDSSDFSDLERASRSGLSHVPSQAMSFPNARAMISRDSCLQPDTRNSLGISRNVLKTTCPV